MATSGAVAHQRKDKSQDDKKLGIDGKAVVRPKTDNDGQGAIKIEVSSPPSSSRPSTTSTTGHSTDMGEPVGALQLPPEAMGVLETVINMNRSLEHQIDALRLKIDVDAKQYDGEKKKISQEKEKQIKFKQTEIDILKSTVKDRESKIKSLEVENEEKDLALQEKLDEILDLKTSVVQTEEYAEKLTKKLDKLKLEKKHLESDVVYKQQSEEIRRLRHELVAVRDKLTIMERELNRAKHLIEQQSQKIKHLEFEKSEMNLKFKEELEKASRAMRQEVERMREVMKAQYEEMRTLREQNKEISSDVRDIKDLLLKNVQTPREPNVDIRRLSPTQAGRQTFINPKPQQQNRSSLPSLTREPTSGKWVPAGTRRSMNALSAKQKK